MSNTSTVQVTVGGLGLLWCTLTGMFSSLKANTQLDELMVLAKYLLAMHTVLHACVVRTNT